MSPGKGQVVREAAVVRGVVQGVGFRPFVYNLARALGLTGTVANTAAGVELEVQGPRGAVEEFFERLAASPPPLASIQALERWAVELRAGESGFEILSSRGGRRRALVPPDVATCEACLTELADPSDRRYRYPFINCTHCGPRFTITLTLPYDRPNTTMARFRMCPECEREYTDPADRRFHAQPIACPACGPRLWLATAEGQEIDCPDPLAEAAKALKQGKIVAIKGLGGFHLAVDATSEQAVGRLRTAKRRWAKPFAVMVRDLAAAEALAELDRPSREALASRERPIVLVPARAGGGLAASVAPGTRLVGLMLPYTPLHHLLMELVAGPLVMTSGNLSEEPICTSNTEAVERLGTGGLAELLLLHDRPIHARCDDSVVRVVGGRMRLWRRSRGFVPAPILLDHRVCSPEHPPLVATGAHLANTFCVLRGAEAFMSQHIGDLEDLGTIEFYEQAMAHLLNLLEVRPEVVACDMHPEYFTTRWAEAQGLGLVRVQHHHAHAAAVMAEAGVKGPVLALSADGTGYGTDGTIWGCELMVATLKGFRRLGRLRPFSLPGGEAAIRQVWRVGVGLLSQVMDSGEIASRAPKLAEAGGQRLGPVAAMAGGGVNSPICSSLGRLFDAVAAICGLRSEAHYEGQAAVELEQAVSGLESAYSFGLRESGRGVELDWEPMVYELLEDVAGGKDPAQVAGAFHAGLVKALAKWVLAAAEATGLREVCLGGGCMANAIVLEGLVATLEQAGLKVYTPAQVPPGDGGIALGQAVIAAAAWRGEQELVIEEGAQE